MEQDFRRPCRVQTTLALVLLVGLTTGAIAAPADEPADSNHDAEPVISEVVVTSQRRQQAKLSHAGNIAQLDVATIRRVQHQHIHELMSQVAGAWVVRGSGQEHQSAIRSPVLAGGGSCGGFLVLEDGIPIRPAGFCNVNQLLETHSTQARSIEVIRGPGNALYGSNALHGIVNVLMPMPGDRHAPNLALEYGANNFVRARASLPFNPGSPWLASAVYADDGGFRDDSGYRQAKLHLKHNWRLPEGDFTMGFTATGLDQDTAGFIYGEDAYKDSGINRSNPNPEAFREVNSQRLYGLWSSEHKGFDIDVRPYFRHSGMEFMHYAQPGKPVEENGQVSTGVISAFIFEGADHALITGLDFEWSDVYVRQTQSEPASGSPRQRATRPQGKHYDYDVDAVSIAVFAQAEYQLKARMSLGAGLRLEYIHYDYDNRMLAGNTREDGSSCGFGGCLFTRPADRTDSFTNLVPNLSAGFQLNDETRVYANLARGYRVPQMTELYRLQNGQEVSDLDSETIDSFELGLRTSQGTWSGEFSLYAMRKQDSVFRDAEGFNVSGARSRHHGVEADVNWQFSPAWWLSANASYARHSYDFDYTPPRGEQFVSGNDIDTAPRWLASARLRFAPASAWWGELAWTYLGEYYLEPQNRFSYPGHQLFNLRIGARVSARLELVARLNNLADEPVADRADFGGGDYRYLPGRGRELFVELRYFPRDLQ